MKHRNYSTQKSQLYTTELMLFGPKQSLFDLKQNMNTQQNVQNMLAVS
jgi:hypothetical protein